MNYLKKNWPTLLTALFMIVIGILLLIDPMGFTTGIIKCAGVLLILLGIYDMIKYFRTEPVEAMKGTGFFSGLAMMAGGAFCVFGTQWFSEAFPMMAVLYGIFQIMVGFRKLQGMVDAMRLKIRSWWLLGISAAVTLLLGFWVASNPNTVVLGAWTFAGVSMIIEGVLDIVISFLTYRSTKDMDHAP